MSLSERLLASILQPFILSRRKHGDTTSLVRASLVFRSLLTRVSGILESERPRRTFELLGYSEAVGELVQNRCQHLRHLDGTLKQGEDCFYRLLHRRKI